MVLAYLGIDLPETEIGRIMGAREYGTPSFAIQKLTLLGVQVNYQEWSFPALLSTLQNQQPVIVFVQTGFLDYYQEDFAHALIIVGSTTDHQFWVHDPAYQAGPLAVSWDGLLAAWAEFGYRGATITRA